MKNIFLAFILFLSCSVFAQTDSSLVNYTDINGMKQGYWLKKDINGNKVYEGTFKDNLPVGEFKRYHRNGVVKAEMVFDKNDQKKASVKLFDDTGELSAIGFYYDKKKDGEWKYFGSKEKLVMKETYQKGMKHGLSVKYFPSGAVVEELEWKNNKMDGEWKRFFENGKIRMKTQHVANERAGEFVVYYPTGVVELRGAYKDDLKEGVWNFYTTKGAIEKTMTFKDGEASNQEEIDALLAEELKEMEMSKGKMADPENFRDNPMEFFQGGRR